MKILKLIVAASLGAATLPVAAFAQGADCTCVTPGSGRGQLGSIAAADGSVLRTGQAGFVAANAGDPIVNGTEIQVGSQSSASINVGTCSLSLEANSLTRVSAAGNEGICVASQNVGGAPGQAAAGTPSWVPGALFGSLAVGAAVLSVTDTGKGSQPASQ